MLQKEVVDKLTARPKTNGRKLLERITAQAFGMRRKIIKTSLKSILGADAAQKLEGLGINPNCRAEELSVEQFCQIANLN